MGKKDGMEIFELFRTGQKSATAEVTPPPMPAVQKPVTQVVRPAPAPAAPAAPRESAIASSPKAGPGEAVISVRLNTALFGLMIGAAGLFGTFALGVQYERHHHPAAAATEENQNRVAAAEPQPAPPVPVVHEPRRDPQPPPVEHPAPPPATPEVRKGYTLQLMSYGSDQESTAQTMLRRVKEAGGSDASVIRDKSNGFVVVAGFVEKQSGPEADAVLAKYRSLAASMKKGFNLNWIGVTR
jgi:hypothetical protein